MTNTAMSDCRSAFSEALLQEGKKNRNIVVVATDSRGSAVIGKFASELPGQFVEAGIAEQNAVGIASGLGLSGKNAFVFSPACFLTLRSAEQVKVDAAYSQANVKIIGVSAGFSYGALGGTHHALQDLAMMSSLPGLMVLSPSDAEQAAQMAVFLSAYAGPAYVRMGRGPVPVIHEKGSSCFVPGRAEVLRQGGDIVLAATGQCVWEAMLAADILKAQGVSASVMDYCCIKPFDGEALLAQAFGKPVLTIEEHGAVGGLGDWAARVLGPAAIRHERLCVADEWAPCASPSVLYRYFNLDAAGIARKALEMMVNKSWEK
jgi:transketolase